VIQVSLDGSSPKQHDVYRGQGSWVKTIAGLHNLMDAGFSVRISTTQTSANSEYLGEFCEFHRNLGISESDHIIRPLAKRGFSKHGVEVTKHNLAPEITINTEGVYWHPLSTEPDMRVSDKIFPLADAVRQVQNELCSILKTSQTKLNNFH